MATDDHRFDTDAVGAAEKIRKRLFVLCDGTWQDGVNKTRPLTNVATLARCLAPVGDNNCLQVVYYDSGVGNVTSVASQLVDGMTGRGISAKIRNAYSFLSHNYDFERGWDEIVLVGFSRGAFAVQCLAAFISDAGLLQKQHLYYLRGLFTLWSLQTMRGGEKKFQDEKEGLEKLDLLRKVHITAHAVWDTVSALGGVLRLPPRPLSFVGKTVPAAVQHAFHALALDERRSNFRPVVWEVPEDRAHNVSQCWFLGAHGDVGGNGDAALGTLSFIWMVGKLRDKIGVKFIEEEILKHLKQRFLEWNFTVNRLRQTLKETRALSTRPHSGLATPSRWYWRLLGQRSRAHFLRLPSPSPGEVHFTVRLAMADDANSSRLLKSWSTAWKNTSAAAQPRIQWRATRTDRNDADHGVPPATTQGQTVATMMEHPLGKDDEEYRILSGWSADIFPPFKTDRNEWIQLHLDAIEVQGTEAALNRFKRILREKLDFQVNRLASEVIY